MAPERGLWGAPQELLILLRPKVPALSNLVGEHCPKRSSEYMQRRVRAFRFHEEEESSGSIWIAIQLGKQLGQVVGFGLSTETPGCDDHCGVEEERYLPSEHRIRVYATV